MCLSFNSVPWALLTVPGTSGRSACVYTRHIRVCGGGTDSEGFTNCWAPPGSVRAAQLLKRRLPPGRPHVPLDGVCRMSQHSMFTVSLPRQTLAVTPPPRCSSNPTERGPQSRRGVRFRLAAPATADSAPRSRADFSDSFSELSY